MQTPQTLHINEKTTEEKIINFIKEQTKDLDGVAIGLSGGIDSALTATLAVEALGKDKVFGLILPSKYTKQSDIEDAKNLAEKLNIEYRTIDITPIFEKIKESSFSDDRVSGGNIMARTRMILLRDLARSKRLIVIGTGNKSELMVGYFTKDGDGGVDILPIGGLYKTQVRALAKYMNLDRNIIEKAPSAGLWEGQEDEKEMGITYEKLDIILDQIETGASENDIITASETDKSTIDKIRKMIRDSAHKRNPTPICTIDTI